MRELDLKQLNNIEKYLGVSLAFGRSKKGHMLSIKERIEAKISSWKECQPSRAGKATLIQLILQAMLYILCDVSFCRKTLYTN